VLGLVAVAALALLGLAACGGGDSSTQPTDPRGPTALAYELAAAIEAGTSQIVPIAEQLNDEIDKPDLTEPEADRPHPLRNRRRDRRRRTRRRFDRHLQAALNYLNEALAH
jgi:hypothetical protein